MTGAMYSAVAGLKTHMQALNVIGNNIANVNTNGYKAGRYVFQSALYNSLRGGSNGSVTVGGKNPSQIGYGTSISSVDINMSTSNYVPTGKATDCMIDGDGFFLTGRKGMTFETAQDFKSFTLTRVGDIEFKADGYLCKPDGNVVYGFKCLGFAEDGKTAVVSNQLQEICKPKITADGQVVYTAMQYQAMRQAALAEAGDLGDDQTLAGWPESFNDLSYALFDSITIDEGTGQISGIIQDTDQNIVIGFIAIGTVDNPNGVSQETGTYYRCGDGAGEMYISLLGGAGQTVYDSNSFNYVARSETVNDETGETFVTPAHWQMNEGAFTEERPTGDDVTQADLDAYEARRLAALSLTHINGKMTGGGEGEEPEPAPDSMILHTGGTTILITGGLEQTDTDLATEISNMIMIQRGYQANTRIVTVTDSMLEELVNMKR